VQCEVEEELGKNWHREETEVEKKRKKSKWGENRRDR